MIDTMVERVAAALLAAMEAQDVMVQREEGDFNLDAMPVLARAAIEAMREPTKEMLVKGNDAIGEHIDFWNYDSGSGYAVEPSAAFACVNAMIDAALNEGDAK